MAVIDTDYPIVGAGATGLAFADALIAGSDADVVLVDRRHGPGGHWNHAYPFVRLHQPSAFYGVNSRVLGSDSIDSNAASSMPGIWRPRFRRLTFRPLAPSQECG